jgi:hypothetical protein
LTLTSTIFKPFIISRFFTIPEKKFNKEYIENYIKTEQKHNRDILENVDKEIIPLFLEKQENTEKTKIKKSKNKNSKKTGGKYKTKNTIIKKEKHKKKK